MNTNEKIHHPLLYAHLYNHAKEHSTRGLCISEFIDNSISSYLKMSNNENDISNISGCKIKILIDETNPNNLKLEIQDNAGGMTKDELESASKEYYGDHLKNDNELNQYGVGMKFAIFWFGKNGKIWTKQKNNDEYFLDYNALTNKSNDEVAVTLNISNENKIDAHGTIIQIENIWTDNTRNRRILKGDGIPGESLKDIIDTLKYRYREYIKNGLVINFFQKTKDNNIEKPLGNIMSNNIDETHVFEIKSFTLKGICGISNLSNATNEELMEYEAKKSDLKIFKEPMKNNDEYNLLFRLLENNEKLVINEKIIFNNQDLKFKLCFLNEADSKYSGIAIKHCNRFIHHLPNKKLSGTKYGTLPFVNNDRFKDGIDRWLYAEVDLTDFNKYGVTPDKNKAKLIYSEQAMADWDSQFKKIVEKYELFIRNILQKLVNNSYCAEIKRLEKVKKTNQVLSNVSIDQNTNDIIVVQESDEEINKLYKMGNTTITIKKDFNLDKTFDYHEEAKDNLILRYNPDNKYLDKEALEFCLLKLVGLMCLISIGKFEKNENILNIINDITKDQENE